MRRFSCFSSSLKKTSRWSTVPPSNSSILDGTKPAFAALTIIDHLDPRTDQRVEQRLVRPDLNGNVLVGDPDFKRHFGEFSIVAENLVTQPADGSAGMHPGLFHGRQHAERPADVKFRIFGQDCDFSGKIDCLSLIRGKELEPVAEQLLKLVQERHCRNRTGAIDHSQGLP